MRKINENLNQCEFKHKNCCLFFQSTENCGVDYGCYREPENCQNSNCLYIYKYKNDGENIKFEISGKTSDSTASWLSIAFSNDQAMVHFIHD